MKARSHGRIFEAFNQLCVASVMCPWGDVGGKAVCPRRVSISICSDIDSLIPGLINPGHYLWHSPPIAFTGHLEVPDLDRNSCFAPDAHGFIDGAYHTAALVAHVRGINPAQAGSFLG